jgi:hypothetical protein
VQAKLIFINDTTLPIEPEDHILRKLPSNLNEDYVVTDATCYTGGPAHWEIKYRRSNAPPTSAQTIVNNISGHNARVNINSIDNSRNEVVGDTELKDALAKISAAIEASGNKDATESWKDFLEEAAGKKSKSKLKAFWDRTISLAPDIATLTTAVAKVASLMV